jgi:hypothetical protein
VRVRRQVAELREYPPGSVAPIAPVHLTITAAEAAIKTAILVPAALPRLLADGELRLDPPEDAGGLALLRQFAALFVWPTQQ